EAVQAALAVPSLATVNDCGGACWPASTVVLFAAGETAMCPSRTTPASVPASVLPASGVPESGVPESGVPESGVPEFVVPESTAEPASSPAELPSQRPETHSSPGSHSLLVVQPALPAPGAGAGWGTSGEPQ